MVERGISPGPWDVVNKGVLGERSARHEVIDADGKPVVRMPDLSNQSYANARLIARAPELMETLESIVPFLTFHGDECITEEGCQYAADEGMCEGKQIARAQAVLAKYE